MSNAPDDTTPKAATKVLAPKHGWPGHATAGNLKLVCDDPAGDDNRVVKLDAFRQKK